MVAINNSRNKDAIFLWPNVQSEHKKRNKTFQILSVVLSVLLSCIIILTFTLAYCYSGNIVLTQIGTPIHIRKIVCYYTFPSSLHDLQPKDLDPTLCTHIIVGFLSIQNNKLEVTRSQHKVLNDVVNLKLNNTELKILLSVGGAGGDLKFPVMVSNHANRKRFIRSVRIYLTENNIDGIDLDWEYPNKEGDDDLERMHFTQLLEEFRININQHSKLKYLLTVAVPAAELIIDNSYQVPHVNQFVDFINLMTYDYHFYSRLTPFTGLNAPLYQSTQDNGIFSTMNMNYSTNYWETKGMDKAKMNIGLPTYCHSFRLINRLNNGIYSPAKGYGKLGDRGFASYPQLCQFLNETKTVPLFDAITKSPYVANGEEWISFDDQQSLTYKVKYVVENEYGGVMIYSLNADDFKGKCHEGSQLHFPLTWAIKDALHSDTPFKPIIMK